MITFVAGHDMRFRPGTAELDEGSVATLQFKLANAIGTGTISGTPTITADSGVTLTTPSLSGTTLTTKVSGGSADRNYVLSVTMVTTAGETMLGAVELQWKQPGYEFRAGVR
jgi:hypothetical protein